MVTPHGKSILMDCIKNVNGESVFRPSGIVILSICVRVLFTNSPTLDILYELMELLFCNLIFQSICNFYKFIQCLRYYYITFCIVLISCIIRIFVVSFNPRLMANLVSFDSNG